jgi:hypothetical protein
MQRDQALVLEEQVLISSHPELNDTSATDLTGVAQTLISIFAGADDKIRSVHLS